MINIKKPSFREDDIWASNPPGSSDVIRPSDDKMARGFIYGEVPLHSAFNWAGNTFSQFAAHSCKYGVPEWDSETTYTRGSSVTIFDPAYNTRFMYIALEDNSGEDPLTSDKWKIFTEKLSELRDVELINVQHDDILVCKDAVDTDKEGDSEYFSKKWFNKNKYTLMGIDDLYDLYGTTFNASVLTSINTQEFGNTWIKRQFKDITRFMTLNDYYDVTGADTPNDDDILTFDGNWWSPKQEVAFIEYENVIFRPQFFNPPEASQDVVGGIRTSLKGAQQNDLYIFSVQAAVPGRPLNLTATNYLPDRVTLDWNEPATGDPADYYTVYRDNEYIGRVDYPGTTFDDLTGDIYTIYTYVIYAVNDLGKSQASLSAFGMKNDVVSAPVNFKASDSISESYVLCTWDSVLGATNYHLYRKPVGSDDSEYVYLDGGITSGYKFYSGSNEQYEYAVTASNSINESDKSIPDIGSTAARSGSKMYKTNGNFTVPLGHYRIQICANGAGGSGSIGARWWWRYWGGGGYAGEFITKTIDVTPGDLIQISVGAGGQLTQDGYWKDGARGGDTTVTLPSGTVMTAVGGQGGSWSTSGYAGYGGSVHSECTGQTYRDGMHSWRPWWVSGWGGQASKFGHGGSRSGRIAGPGAGGSSVSRYWYWYWWRYDNPRYNKGGDGIVMISWGTSMSGSNTDTEPPETESREWTRNDYINEYKEMFHMSEPISNFKPKKTETMEFEPEAKILEKYK